MSTNNSGVRNLRAMFESRTTSDLATSTSPPSRGRSPADSEASFPSRPVSKVRASFVAVERPSEAGQGQQWGLRKASDVAVMADTGNEQVDSTAPSKSVQDQESAVSVENPSEDDQINGTGGAAADRGSDPAPLNSEVVDGGLGVILKGSAFEPSPVDSNNVDVEDHNVAVTNTKSKPMAKPKPTLQSASLATRMKDAKKDPPPKGNFIASKNAISVLPAGGRIRPPVSTKSPTTPKSPPQKTPISPNVPAKASSPKPAPTEDSSKSTSKTSPRSPTLSKSDRNSLPATKPRQTQPTKLKASDAQPTSNGIKKEASPTSPKSKVQPRSPTKPTRLPAGATAPTTASVAKVSAGPNRPASRASTTATANARTVGTSQPHKPTVKPPTSTTASSLAKKSSRASLASQHETQKPRVSNVHKAPAEGFLARMTRPTASFAQKTHEKLHVHSPPRDKKAPAKTRVRKSTGKSDDDAKEVAHVNGVEDHGPQDLAGGVNEGGTDEEAPPQAEASVQPLADGQQGEESTTQESY